MECTQDDSKRALDFVLPPRETTRRYASMALKKTISERLGTHRLGLGVGGLTRLFRTREFPQPSLSVAARLGRPVRVLYRELGRLRHSVELVPTTRQADCGGGSAVPRVVQHMAGSCQPFFVIRRQSWIITSYHYQRALRARAPLLVRGGLPKVLV